MFGVLVLVLISIARALLRMLASRICGTWLASACTLFLRDRLFTFICVLFKVSSSSRQLAEIHYPISFLEIPALIYEENHVPITVIRARRCPQKLLLSRQIGIVSSDLITIFLRLKQRRQVYSAPHLLACEFVLLALAMEDLAPAVGHD